MNALAAWLQRHLDYRNPNAFGTKLRRKRIAHLVPLLEEIHRRHGMVRILDLGGSRAYWHCLPLRFFESLNLTFTLVNLTGSVPPLNEPRFHFIEGDGCQLSGFADNAFDLVHSNSVIEHVGDWARMQAFAREVRRLAKAYYVQTPSFYFPIEPHAVTPFLHWLPKTWRIALLQRMPLGRYPRCHTKEEARRWIEDSQLLTYRQMRALFPDAEILREQFLGMTKSFMAIRHP